MDLVQINTIENPGLGHEIRILTRFPITATFINYIKNTEGVEVLFCMRYQADVKKASLFTVIEVMNNLRASISKYMEDKENAELDPAIGFVPPELPDPDDKDIVKRLYSEFTEEELRKKLAEAESEEDYETAVVIRDEIKIRQRKSQS